MELIESFLHWKRYSQGKSEGTCIKYRCYLDRLVEYLPGELIEATRDQLEAFVGLEAHKAGMAPRSRRVMVAAVRGFYEWLKREGKLVSNPAETIEYPRSGRRLPNVASLDAAEKLLMAPDLDTFKGVRDAAILAMLIGGGFRVSGVVNLNDSHLIWYRDGEAERLAVRVTEKGNKQRMVPMPAEARLLLRAYLGHPELRGIDRLLEDGDKVLFVSLRNRLVPEHDYRGEARRISAQSIDAMIKLYGERQGIPQEQLHAHALRHLYGTELAESDVDILRRQALMGHADPKTTEIYTHLAMRKISQTVDLASPLGKIKTPVSELLRHIENKK